MTTTRRFAVILWALTPSATIDTQTSLHAWIQKSIERFQGRAAASAGDHLLAEFASAVDAVECALVMQETLTQGDAGRADEPREPVSIGVTAGDVLVDGDLLHGDTITIAAYLATLAQPGGVAISSAAHENIVSALRCEYEPLGPRSIPGLHQPVRVYRVIGKAPALSAAHPDPSPAPPQGRHSPGARRPSIAVLPFREYDVPPDTNYFAEGIVEEIIGALAALPDLLVISRSSSLRFRGPDVDVRAVGEELGVRYVLSGSVRRAADRIRTVAELCDVQTGGILWTDWLEGTTSEVVFALQDRLSKRIVTTIAPHVRQAELHRAARKQPGNLDAYDFVLRGWDLLYRLRREEFERAQEMFQRAIALEPGYATPYALSATWYSIRIGQGWSANSSEDMAAVNRLATAALERDPFDARALSLCGHLRSFLFRDYDGAIALFERAATVSPNSTEAWVWSSPTYSYIGDGAEAARRAEHALLLSPLDPHRFLAHTALALAAYTRGDGESAVTWGRKSIAENPRYTASQRILIAGLIVAGRMDEARRVAKTLLEQDPAFRVEAFCRAHPYKDPARREVLAGHLRSAGLP